MKKNLIILSTILGLVFLYFSFIYFTHSANTLPNYLPGYDISLTKIHYKHAIALLLLSIFSFVFAWMKSGKSN